MAESDMKLDLIISATDLASREIKNIKNQLQGLTSSTNKVGKASDGIFGGMKIGWAAVGAAVVGATVAVKQFASEAIDASISYESAFAGVKKTIDATEEEFENLSDSYKKMSEEIPVAFEELSKIGELGGQLGVGVNDIENFTSTIAKLGASVDSLGMEDAAMELAQFANVTKVGNQNIDKLASTLVELGNNSATTEAMIMNFSSRLQGAGANAGISASAIMGIATTFASAGVEAEAGGTAVSKVINKMKEAAVAGGKNLNKFSKAVGMTTKEFKDLMNTNPDKALVKFMQALNGAGDEAQIMLSNLGLNDVRLTSAFLSAAQNADQLEGYINMANKAYEENMALTDEASKRFATTESQITMAQNERKNMMAELGDKIKPLILLWENLKTAALGFFMDVITPIADFVASLNLSAEAGEGMVASIQGAFQSFHDRCMETFGPLFEKLNGFREEHGSTITAIRETVKATVGATLEDVRNTVSFVFNQVISIVKLVGGIIIDTFDYAFTQIGNIVTLFTQIFQGDWEGALNTLKTMRDTFVGWFKDIFSGIGQYITESVGNITDWIGGKIDMVMGWINKVRDAWKSVTSLFSSEDTGKALENKAAEGMKKFNDKIRAKGESIAGAMAEGGHVSAGSTYLVGERGPELFVPNTSGTVVPNNEITNNNGIEINMGGVTVRNESDIQSLANEIVRMIKLEKNYGII